MAKLIKYDFLSCEINKGTEEEPVIEQVILPKCIVCNFESEYAAVYAIAEREAIPGTIEVSGEFYPEPVPVPDPSSDSVWEELDAAYQKGVDSV